MNWYPKKSVKLITTDLFLDCFSVANSKNFEWFEVDVVFHAQNTYLFHYFSFFLKKKFQSWQNWYTKMVSRKTLISSFTSGGLKNVCIEIIANKKQTYTSIGNSNNSLQLISRFFCHIKNILLFYWKFITALYWVL